MAMKRKPEERLTALLLCFFLIFISPTKSEDKLFCYNPLDVPFVSNLGSQPPFIPRVSCDASGLMVLPANLVPSVQSCESRFPNCLYCDGVSCTECQPEFSLITDPSSRCIHPCGLGHYYKFTSDTCDSCPSGTYGDLEMTTVCKECGAGTYSLVGQTVCVQCGDGAVAPESGSAVCEICNEGFFANALHTDCIKCSAGSMCHNGKQTLCNPGTFQSAEGKNDCNVCSFAKYCARSGCTSCEACPVFSVTSGTSAFSHDSPTDCRCLPGFSGTPCARCSPGYYNPSVGGDCVPCNAGTWSEAGSTSCSNCPAGFSCIGGQKHECEPGTYAVGGASVCSVCENGFFTPAFGQQDCDRCPTESTTTGSSPSDHDQLTDCVCNDGYFRPESSSDCSICPAGSRCVNSEMYSCTPGTFSLAGSTSCSPCAQGSFAEGLKATSCTNCPDYSTTPPLADPDDHDELADCACIPGTTGTDPSSCELCPAGHYCPTPTASPILCPPGTYAINASVRLACPVCPQDMYSEGTGNEYCTRCPPASGIVGNLPSDHSDLFLCECDCGYPKNPDYRPHTLSPYCIVGPSRREFC